MAGEVKQSASPFQAISIAPYFPKTRYRSSHVKGEQSSYVFPKRVANNTRSADTTRLRQPEEILSIFAYLPNDNLPRTNFVFAIGAPLVVMNIGRAV